ncbi:MAG: UvrD-helicase domain-containing protein [Acidobacteria bacterium]|nr:UvrD-helicase domain-containing protein [Acidobacteriota bacterium]MCB9398831.1 UvrD-helicase domain-containing protein [Acidobacteriota bacterium]
MWIWKTIADWCCEMEAYLQVLNAEQRAAVEAPDGPTLVLAGAGSGKTRVIITRISHLIHARAVSPFRILAMTFTNKAASEMKERVEQQVMSGSIDITVTTFHSFCARFLRREIDVLGRESSFAIYDASDQQQVIKRIIKKMDLNSVRYPPGRLKAIISQQKNAGEWGAKPENETERRVYEAYQEELERSNALDFDDLLVLTLRILNESEECRTRYQNRFRHILVDEYQDTNKVQLQLLKRLCGPDPNLFAVGDEDQSIYGWRGAQIENILEFNQHFPGAHVFKLERNYRSTAMILEFANRAIAANQQRNPKNLWTEAQAGAPVRQQPFNSARDEADFIARQILDLKMKKQAEFSDFAILFRSNFLSRSLEEVMRTYRIPYQLVGGTKFYDRKEIKDLLAYMRIVVNPKDWSNFERAIGIPSRGIGQKSLDTIARFFHESVNLDQAMAATICAKALSSKAHNGLESFLALYRKMSGLAESEAPSVWLAQLVQEIEYVEYLSREDELSAENRVGNIDELIASVRELEEEGTVGTLAAFLDHSALISDADQIEDKKKQVSLMTVHAAKGLEFDHVFVMGLEEGVFPNQRALDEREAALEEERRLFYVAVTRARQHLFLSYARQRQTFGNTTYGIPSRFLRKATNPETEPQPQAMLPLDLPEKSNRPLRGKTVRAGDLANHLKDLEDQMRAQNIHISLAKSEGGKTASPRFRVGQMVIHPKFGHGKIVQIAPSGTDRRIGVLFLGKGTKMFMESKAPLKPM